MQKSFTQKVLEVVKDIPKGETLSYKQVATRAGNLRACRVVGSILKKNFNPQIPCHRVIKSDGTLGEYNRGREEKERKLKEEGAIK